MQSKSEMLENQAKKRKTSQMYKAQSMALNDGEISEIVARKRAALESARSARKVHLNDVDGLQRVAAEYMEACAVAGTVPSMTGYALACGLSRQALYDCLARRSPPEAARWLEAVHDVFADALAEASLKGAVAQIPAIFVLKAAFGWRESVEVVTRPPESPLGPEPDRDELEARLADIVIDDEEAE